jgi:hypothetical protein
VPGVRIALKVYGGILAQKPVRQVKDVKTYMVTNYPLPMNQCSEKEIGSPANRIL